jgi:hypothetical protein
MSPQRIILVLADRSTEAQSSLHKASVLARHLDASIDIFLCDTDHAWAVREQAHSAEARAVVAACDAENERFLQALRGSVCLKSTPLRAPTTKAAARAVFRPQSMLPRRSIRSVRHSPLTALLVLPAPWSHLRLQRAFLQGRAPLLIWALTQIQ